MSNSGPESVGSAYIGTDIGGTFTDFAVLDAATGEVRIEKRLTTPDDPARAVLEGLDVLEAARPGLMAAADVVAHGTTLAINALIERTGSRTGLLATEGFIDLLDMRREVRYDAYDLDLQMPTVLVPRRLRRGIRERTHASGKVLIGLDVAAAESAIDELAHLGVDSIAVCLLHGYANPEHEEMLGRIIHTRHPDILTSLSSQVLPEIREYERTSTTVANAYVQRLMIGYLESLAAGLDHRGFGGQLQVMQSTGGVIPIDTACAFPIRMVESGPAGGVIAAVEVAGREGCSSLVAFDMGGTTAKIAPVMDGNIAVTHDYEVARTAHFHQGSGIPISTPVVDLLEIGTGGGSIARVDSLGLVKVGPDSAGSVPGPACYGQGGIAATVTDADLVLGFLDAENFLGGEMSLRTELAHDALQALGADLGVGPIEAAQAIRESVDESMAAAARVHLADLGLDANVLPFVAYGGAGPVHAAGIAARLGSPRVLIPPAAGVMSALGLTLAPITFETARTYKVRSELTDLQEMDQHFERMQAVARASLSAMAGSAQVRFDRWVDMRYVGQGFEVSVDLPDATQWLSLTSDDLAKRFREAYEHRYGRAYEDVTVETMNLRLRATLEYERAPGLVAPLATGRRADQAVSGGRVVHFADGEQSCTIYDRALLEPGMTFKGPALVQERETVTAVPPGASVQIGELGSIIIDLEGLGTA